MSMVPSPSSSVVVVVAVTSLSSTLKGSPVSLSIRTPVKVSSTPIGRFSYFIVSTNTTSGSGAVSWPSLALSVKVVPIFGTGYSTDCSSSSISACVPTVKPSLEISSNATTVSPKRSEESNLKVISTLPLPFLPAVNVFSAVTGLPSESRSSPPSVIFPSSSLD